MSIGINSSYSPYDTQVSYNSRSNTDKTTVSNTSTIDKTTSKDEYFKNLCDKYSNVNLNMSDSHLNKENELTYNVSPKLINKAINDPKAAENLDRLLDQIPSLKQYISTHKYSLDGSCEVNSVSVVIDENGGCSCKIELKQKDSKNTSKTSDEENLLEKKIKEKREKAKDLKEAQDENSKGTKEQKVSNYYKNIATNFDINLLDKFDRNI